MATIYSVSKKELIGALTAVEVAALSGSYIITSEVEITQISTIPSTVDIEITTTGRLKLTADLTFNGTLSASNYQIFTGAGTLTGLKESRPEWFGIGATSLLSALNSIVSDNGKVVISSGSVIDLAGTDVNIPATKNRFLVTGPGEIKNGSLIFQGSADCRVENVRFSNDTWTAGTSTGSAGIKIKTTRKLNISHCSFDNLDKAIYIVPDAAATFHSTAMIHMTDNTFNEVNYALYQQQHASIVLSTYTVNDLTFANNIINNCYITHILFSNIDGLNVHSNIMFMSGSGAVKSSNIRITGIHDQVMITNNQLFEAGEAGIWLTDSKRVIITGNNIVWPGARVASSAILFDGNQLTRAVINGNILSQFSKHGVEFNGSASTVFVDVRNNNIEYAVSPVYYGATDLATIPHYSIYSTLSTTQYSPNTANVPPLVATISSWRDLSSIRQGISRNELTTGTSVTAANTKIFTLASTLGATGNLGGLVLVTAKASLSSTANTAYYLLFIKNDASGSAVIEISKTGLTAGAGASHPSFTWTLDTTTRELRASPVASTTGTFYFFLMAIGDIATL